MHFMSQIKKIKLKNNFIRYYYDPSHDDTKYKLKNNMNEVFFNNSKFEEYINKKINEEVMRYFADKKNTQTSLEQTPEKKI